MQAHIKEVAAVFDEVAAQIYDILPRRQQYNEWVKVTNVIQLPDLPKEVDMRYTLSYSPSVFLAFLFYFGIVIHNVCGRHYNRLMDQIPQHCVSVPLVLNSILDQLIRILNKFLLLSAFLVYFLSPYFYFYYSTR